MLLRVAVRVTKRMLIGFLFQELENFDIEVMAQRDFTDPYLGESNVTSTFTRIVEETYTRTRGRRAA